MKKCIPFILCLGITLFSIAEAVAQCCQEVHVDEDTLVLNLLNRYATEDSRKYFGECCSGTDIIPGISGVLRVRKTVEDGKNKFIFSHIRDDRFKTDLPHRWSYVGSSILLIYESNSTPNCTSSEARRNIDNMLKHIGSRVYIIPPEVTLYYELNLGKERQLKEYKKPLIAGNPGNELHYIQEKDGTFSVYTPM